MISYRDMTFCDHWQDCAKAAKCHRPLTSDIALAARKWWGSDDAPISVFLGKPECHEPAKDAAGE